MAVSDEELLGRSVVGSATVFTSRFRKTERADASSSTPRD
jgi:hypothetical protein